MEDRIETFRRRAESELGVRCAAAPMDESMFHAELRSACAQNVCGCYGTCHTCPPNIGPAEECIERVKAYSTYIAFQKVYTLEDSFDFEGMVAGKNDFQNVIQGAAKLAREIFGEPLILGAGGCTLCPTCAAAEGKPCRMPDRAIQSLEANCIQVSEFARHCGLKYINGADTVTYFGGVFLK
ncbi:MAG: DUF2284 domain-containing protein [Oscillospiraceae bacterium]|nr:DUF2284 domain-containing protein [Oscillospiraceae bacterium]